MFVRGTPCSFCICVIWVIRNATKATTRNGVPQGKSSIIPFGTIDVLLGSSLPIRGGGTMKKFRKIDLLILILKLLVHLIDWLK